MTHWASSILLEESTDSAEGMTTALPCDELLALRVDHLQIDRENGRTTRMTQRSVLHNWELQHGN